MPSLEQRLLAIEDECFTALMEGGDALSKFNNRWELLVSDIDAAHEHSTLDSNLLTLVHTTATRVAVLMDTSAELLASCEDLTKDFVHDMETLLSQMSIHDSSSGRVSSPSYSHCSISPVRAYPSSRSSSSSRRSSLSQGSSPPRIPSSPSPPPRSIDLKSGTSMKSASRKRKGSCDHDSACGPSKRQCVMPSRATNMSTSIVTPATQTSKEATGAFEIPQPQFQPQTTSRKRRRSDADLTLPQTAKRLYVGPRLHAVSDTFIARQSSHSLSASSPDDSSEFNTPSPSVSPPNRSLAPFTEEHNRGLDIHNEFERTCLASIPSLPELQNLDNFLKSLLDADVSMDFTPFEATTTATLPSNAVHPSCNQWSQPMPNEDFSPSPVSSPSYPPTPPAAHYAADRSPPQYELYPSFDVQDDVWTSSHQSSKHVFSSDGVRGSAPALDVDLLLATMDWPYASDPREESYAWSSMSPYNLSTSRSETDLCSIIQPRSECHRVAVH